MYQGSYHTHLSASHGDPRDREANRVAIYEAVQVIRDAHDVCEKTAYTLLVEASADARSSVREAAAHIVMGSAQLPPAEVRPPRSRR